MSITHALVVDDSKSAGLALRRLLEQTKVAVDLAESAEAALEYLKANKPDVIFMDHIMPGMNGFEAAKVISGEPSTSAIPIVMYTSKDDDGYFESAKAHGAVGILPKPPKADALNKVLTALGGAPMQAATPSPAVPPKAAPAPAAPMAAASEKAIEAAVRALLPKIVEDLRREMSTKMEQIARDIALDVQRTRTPEQEKQFRKNVEEIIRESLLHGKSGLTPAELDDVKAAAREASTQHATDAAKRVATDVAEHAATETAKRVATDTARHIAHEAARKAAEEQYQLSVGGLSEKLLGQVKTEMQALRDAMNAPRPLTKETLAEIEKIAQAAAQIKATDAVQRVAGKIAQEAALEKVESEIDQLKRDLDGAIDPQLKSIRMMAFVGIGIGIIAAVLSFVM